MSNYIFCGLFYVMPVHPGGGTPYKRVLPKTSMGGGVLTCGKKWDHIYLVKKEVLVAIFVFFG